MIKEELTRNEIEDRLFGIGTNSYNRFEKFLEMRGELDGENVFYALMNAYISSDNLYEYRDEIKESFGTLEPKQPRFLEVEDEEYFNALPDQVTIYRGMTVEEFEGGEYGVSWSLKKEVAEFFANTYGRNHSTSQQETVVMSLTISKNEIISFTNDRNEFEVIYINN